MRITGGEYRGRKIYSGKTKSTRPATDRVRETIFAIIPQYIDFTETTVIDLYAGTGSLGFESLSRGAKYVVFVDSSREAIKAIQRTAHSLGCGERCDIVLSMVERYVKHAPRCGELLFADPPYEMADSTRLPGFIARSAISAPNAVLLIEHSKQTTFPEDQMYTVFRQKMFGNSIVSFFRLSEKI